MQNSVEPFSQAVAAIVARIGLKDAKAIEHWIAEPGIMGYWDGSRLLAITSGALALDATFLLAEAMRLGASSIEVVVIEGRRSRLHLDRARLLAGAFASQLGSFEIDVQVSLATSPESVLACEASDFLAVVEGFNDRSQPSVEVPDGFGRDLALRFGEPFLEHLGLAFAKFDAPSGRWMPGVSAAENELLDLSMGERDLGAVLRSTRTVIDSRRHHDSFGRFRNSLLSRWLGERLMAEPQVVGASGLSRLDVYRDGYLGANPFSDLSRTGGGFWGVSDDFNDFLLAEMSEGGNPLLLGVAGTLDLGVVVRTAEVAANLGTRHRGLRSAVVLGGESYFAPHLLKWSSRLRTKGAVVVLASSWRDSVNLEVIENGLQRAD